LKVYAKGDFPKQAEMARLQQVFATIFLEPFHYFTDVLGALAWTN